MNFSHFIARLQNNASKLLAHLYMPSGMTFQVRKVNISIDYLFFFHNLHRNMKYSPLFYNLCILVFSMSWVDDYYITVLWGDCAQYTFTNDHLEELGKHAININDVNWSILAQDPIMNYKIIEVDEWKDQHLFYIKEEGTWENWTQDVIEQFKNKKKD